MDSSDSSDSAKGEDSSSDSSSSSPSSPVVNKTKKDDGKQAKAKSKKKGKEKALDSEKQDKAKSKKEQSKDKEDNEKDKGKDKLNKDNLNEEKDTEEEQYGSSDKIVVGSETLWGRTFNIVTINAFKYLVGVQLAQFLGKETFNMYKSMKVQGVDVYKATPDQVHALRVSKKLPMSSNRSLTLCPYDGSITWVEGLWANLSHGPSAPKRKLRERNPDKAKDGANTSVAEYWSPPDPPLSTKKKVGRPSKIQKTTHGDITQASPEAASATVMHRKSTVVCRAVKKSDAKKLFSPEKKGVVENVKCFPVRMTTWELKEQKGPLEYSKFYKEQEEFNVAWKNSLPLLAAISTEERLRMQAEEGQSQNNL